MKKVLTLTLILSFFALSAVVLSAQPRQRMSRVERPFDRSQNRIFLVLKANQEELGITDDQLAKIEDLVYLNKEYTIKMNGEHNLLRLDLQKLMQDRENLDYDKIKALLAKTSALRNEMFVKRLKLRDEINMILTPEQQKALEDMGRVGMRSRSRDLRERMMQRFPRLRDRIRRW